MSLATRCSKCGTIFRVVQDQLKVSEGWVRCGRCQEVFNALEGLFDLEREAPPQRPRSALTATQVAAQDMAEFVASHSPSTPALTTENFPATAEDDAIESRFLARITDEADEEDDPDFVDARFPSELPLDAAGDVEPAAAAAAPALPAGAVPEPPGKKPGWFQRRAERRAAASSSMLGGSGNDEQAAAAAPLPVPALPPGAPGFLRQAEADARWRRPRVRASLVLAGLLLLGMLATQVALQFRDVLAARWIEARPALATLCELMGCQIEPLRRLAALTVEASGLTQVEGSEAYRLSLTLLNRDTVPLALPSVDLRITDASGALIARRALASSDFQVLPGGTPPGPALAAGSEAQLQAFLAARGARISGYTVELFYP